MNLSRQHGFTLWELLITMLVAGVLIGIGVPNVMEFQRNSAMTAAANQLLTGLIMARTEAVKRQVPVGVCLSANPTAASPTCSPNAVANSADLGFIVWVDENKNVDANKVPILTDATDGNGIVDANEDILMREAPRGVPIKVSANCGYVSFAPTGFTRAVAGLCNPTPRDVLYCDDRGRRVAAGSLSSARIVTINPTGRGQVLQETTDIDPRIAGTGGTCP